MRIFGRSRGTGWIDRDYIPLEVPRGEVQILDVYNRQRRTASYQRLGGLTDILSSTSARPLSDGVQRHLPIPNMDHLVDRTSKLSFAVAALDRFLSVCGVKLAVDGQRTKSAQIQYQLENAFQDIANLILLDEWLSQADLVGHSPTAADVAVSNRLYVSVGAVFATTVKISLLDAGDARVNVDARAGQNLPSVGCEVAYANSQQTVAFITAARPLCVGIKLARVFCELPHGFRVGIDPIARADDTIRGSRPTERYEFAAEDEIRLDEARP